MAVDDTENSEILDSFRFKAMGIHDSNPPDWKFDPKNAFERKEFMQVFYDCLSGLNDSMGQAFALRELKVFLQKKLVRSLN